MPVSALRRNVSALCNSHAALHSLEPITLEHVLRILYEQHRPPPWHAEELIPLAGVHGDLEYAFLPLRGEIVKVTQLHFRRGQRLHEVRAIQREAPAVRTPVGIGVRCEGTLSPGG